MEEYKVLQHYPTEYEQQYPTITEEGRFEAELVARIWNDKICNSSTGAIECLFNTFRSKDEKMKRFRTFVFGKEINGQSVWTPKSNNLNFYSPDINDEFNDGVGDFFILDFKKNRNGKIYLDTATLSVDEDYEDYLKYCESLEEGSEDYV